MPAPPASRHALATPQPRRFRMQTPPTPHPIGAPNLGKGGRKERGWGRGKGVAPSPPPSPGPAPSEHRRDRAAAGPAQPPHEGRAPPSSTLSVGQARKMVEQLKIEASLCRVKVSKAAAELLSYCEAHACEDPLLTPVPTSENPFREKKFFCALL
ncbi:guanine nucleotide-binding protein G(I)/G(S)/G(O) subunit gamma-3 [Agelaius phoeniceus]|uniref:guanine nucleotide-binding protein G(I)/G(S)/G(O) subunit gamma-3 n=1 Tax=Agelaius phoeniceus TaxID=39638 RepID=UPI004055202C